MSQDARNMVDHPAHYTNGPFECITLTSTYSFRIGNAVKYVWRHPYKNRPVEDLDKAAWYLDSAKKAGERPTPRKPDGTPPDNASLDFNERMLAELIAIDWSHAAPFWRALRDRDMDGMLQAVRALRETEARDTPDRGRLA